MPKDNRNEKLDSWFSVRIMEEVEVWRDYTAMVERNGHSGGRGGAGRWMHVMHESLTGRVL